MGKKFDIRVWVLVTSVSPLVVWLYTDPYVRFTSSDYDSTRLFDKFSHLTNASISKKAPSKTKSKGQYKIKNNMWGRDDLQVYLANEYSDYAADPFVDIVMPQIKEGVIDSLLAVHEVLHHRDRSHELFGYDFMVRLFQT